ncbi:hypothetical protein CDAR_7901 [Caerostris darwini]|uniref:Transmembrane protein n=1 Tax=Caerostris darwini TaxID=1538125 RepID=A0AAV4QAY1_9ARAC|nr:hypothetical protein CDAR_7901 [Caerostris darwini]
MTPYVLIHFTKTSKRLLTEDSYIYRITTKLLLITTFLFDTFAIVFRGSAFSLRWISQRCENLVQRFSGKIRLEACSRFQTKVGFKQMQEVPCLFFLLLFGTSSVVDVVIRPSYPRRLLMA